MAWYIIVGVLAAFGTVSALWAMLGWLLPAGKQGTLIFAGKADAGAFARRYLWLRGAGFLSCPLIVVEPEDCDEAWLAEKGIEICTLEELSFRLGIGAEEN